MKLVFNFPRKGVEPRIEEINNFLSNTDLVNNEGRKFGVYRKLIGIGSKKSKMKVFLQFKFFEKPKQEIEELRIEINQGDFDGKVAKEKQVLEELYKDVKLLSYIASLELQSVEFSINGEFLSVTVALDDYYQKFINDHKKLIFSTI